jgi:flagellar basal body-associated protein FliL
METIIAIGIVVLAAAGVGYGLYRSASSKRGCNGCHGCQQGQEICNPDPMEQD